jgi:peptidoglycan LD-endopeptidase LytH
MSRKLRRRLGLLFVLLMIGAAGAIIGWRLYRRGVTSPTRAQLSLWLSKSPARAALITELAQPCPGAPFLLPSRGFVGFLYDDSTAPYLPTNPHPGFDIFGDGEPGEVPVYAAYDGYLTRLPDWKSAVIIRIPRDPRDPSRQIWTYYAHMASESGDRSYISAAFPAGTSEKFVKQGTLLGYQGLYAGNASPIALHVHFSIVLSDENGAFRNEARFSNTIDPSPYFGMTLNAARELTIPVSCGK